ncbi:MAG: CerR family C-terminal domain-containing protein [Acidobacteriota bacterium]
MTGAITTDEGAGTRSRLLDAAERLFAERGFAATSVREITAAAECNLAAVNYHFGGKLELYHEVFRRRLAAMRERRLDSIRQAREVDRAADPLAAVLAAFASAFLEPLVDSSKGRLLMALISREMLDPQLPRELFVAEIVEPVQGALIEAIAAAAPGLSRAAAKLCVTSIIGQLLQVAHRARQAELAPGNGAPLPPLSVLVAHIVQFSAAGIRACCEEELSHKSTPPQPECGDGGREISARRRRNVPTAT